MKLFRDFLSRHRFNKRKVSSSSSSPVHIKSNHPIHQPCCNQTLNLFGKDNRCTCHYFNFNENCLTKDVHTKLLSNHSISSPRLSINIIPSLECLSDVQYILTVADFCFWYDVRSTLLDVIDRVVALDETRRLRSEPIPPMIIKYCLPSTSIIHRKNRRTKTSIAIQTTSECERQQRNAKVQTNTVTLFPLSKANLSSSKVFFN